mmetsp:Transcript_38382/g.96147  ORF Transcript_38382/g.96147 Transcript_38382/m.96147 type:complete len:346 (+) Transcript_38382:409-1446(+)
MKALPHLKTLLPPPASMLLDSPLEPGGGHLTGRSWLDPPPLLEGLSQLEKDSWLWVPGLCSSLGRASSDDRELSRDGGALCPVIESLRPGIESLRPGSLGVKASKKDRLEVSHAALVLVDVSLPRLDSLAISSPPNTDPPLGVRSSPSEFTEADPLGAQSTGRRPLRCRSVTTAWSSLTVRIATCLDPSVCTHALNSARIPLCLILRGTTRSGAACSLGRNPASPLPAPPSKMSLPHTSCQTTNPTDRMSCSTVSARCCSKLPLSTQSLILAPDMSGARKMLLTVTLPCTRLSEGSCRYDSASSTSCTTCTQSPARLAHSGACPDTCRFVMAQPRLSPGSRSVRR